MREFRVFFLKHSQVDSQAIKDPDESTHTKKINRGHFYLYIFFDLWIKKSLTVINFYYGQGCVRYIQWENWQWQSVRGFNVMKKIIWAMNFFFYNNITDHYTQEHQGLSIFQWLFRKKKILSKIFDWNF